MLFRGLKRHWWQILALWSIATIGLLLLIYLKVHPLFEASSLLRVEPSRADLFGTDAHASELFEPYLKTQVQLIASPNVLATAVADPRVATLPAIRGAHDAEVELGKRLEVRIVPDSYLIKVSLLSESSKEAATIVNAVVNAYLAAAAEWSDGMTRAQIKNLETYQRELQDQADEKQEVWLTLASKSNLDPTEELPDRATAAEVPLSNRSRMTLEEFKRVRELLFKTNIELVEARALLAMRNAELGNAGSGVEERLLHEARQAFHAEPAVAALLQSVDRARRRLITADRIARNQNDPARVGALRDLKSLQDQYSNLWELEKANLLAGSRSQVSGGLGGSVQEIASRVDSLAASKEGYEKFLNEIDVLNKQEGTDAVRLALVRESLTSLKTMQDAVSRRLEQLRFESKGEARISKVNEARPSVSPIKDSRMKLLLLTPAGVLAVLVGAALLMELKSGRVVDAAELSRRMPAGLYTLPHLPSPNAGPRAGQRASRGAEGRLVAFLQGIDHIRAALCHEVGGEAGRCLVIASASSGEGKTTLALQLATCCRNAGIATLVIDADMRRASLTQLLEAEWLPGLSDVLKGDIGAEDALFAVQEGGFFFLPSGTSEDQPGLLLHGPRFRQVLAAYRSRFQVILIDSPPVLPVPDALTMGRFTDGVVLVVRQDTSRFPLVDQARERLFAAGIPILKTVFNGVKLPGFLSGYHHGYPYGNGYEYAYAYSARSERANRAVEASEPPA